MKLKLLAAFVLLIGAAAGITAWLSEAPVARKRPNVLVVSTCSLRYDRIGVFNPNFKLTPKIDAWAKDAFVFPNGMAEMPWQNWSFEASDLVGIPFVTTHGYRAFTEREALNRFLIPPVEIDEEKQVWYWDESAILNYGPSLAELKQSLIQRTAAPFFAFVHLKYLHYPYLDTVNMGDSDWNKLSPKSRELLNKYRATPEKYDAQLPLIELMTNSFSLLKKKLKLKTDVFAVAGVVSDTQLNKRWQQDPSFADDLRLVQELYDLKMPRYDDMAADILNLYGEKDLQDRTVVIFAGDHGEAFAEHGVVGHSVNVYDEMLRFPLVIKFPGATGEKIEAQLTHRQLAFLVRRIMAGEITAENFAAEIRGFDQEFVLSRNCSDTIRSVRYRNEWKLIKNLDSDRNELYDLKADPGERKNVIAENADMAWKLEEYMVDNQDQFKRQNRSGRRAQVCIAN